MTTIYQTAGYKSVSYENFKPNKSEYLIERYSRKKPNLLKDFISLDTETSHNHNKENPIGWLYQWSFEYQQELIYGRTPSQLTTALNKILAVNECNEKNKAIVYIHNLSYDFSYLVQYFELAFGKPTKVLAYDKHKLFYIEYEQIVFKCSYKLSNKSLAKWGKDLGIEHQKLVGAIDYNAIHYQDEELTAIDWEYMFYDVIALKECIIKQLAIYNDDLLSVPMTSTGYVRRELRKAYKQDKTNFYEFRKSELSSHFYNFYRNEFAGGITHGNRFYADKTIIAKELGYERIEHGDFASHYPSQQRVRFMPCGKTFLLFSIKNKKRYTIRDAGRDSKKYCLQLKILIKDLELKSKSITMPYAQTSHFKPLAERGAHFIEDNGRILKMTGKTIIYVNELDLYWLQKQYKFNYLILEVLGCKKAYLPAFMLDTIDLHYKAKSDLKQAVKELKKANASKEDIREAELDLMKSKALLNGIYGCSATDPVRDELELDGVIWERKKGDIETELAKFYKSQNNFMRFEWGCYTTAWARFELMEFIELVGYDNFIYCDTDSIFYLTNSEIDARVEAKNRELREEAERLGAYITTDKGEKVYYNHFDSEGENIQEFRFLHSKCYAYNQLKDDKLELSVTVAGVTAVGRENVLREDELGSIDNLTDGFIFESCGGTACTYVDTPVQKLHIDGHLVELGASAIISNVNKTLSYNIDRDTIIYNISYDIAQ